MVRLSYERLRLGETWFSSYASELIISEVKWTSASDASPSAMACNEKEVPVLKDQISNAEPESQNGHSAARPVIESDADIWKSPEAISQGGTSVSQPF